MKTFFLPIQNRLLANVPSLETVDMDWGQLDEPQENYSVQFPCVLIDVPDTDFERTGVQAQPGTASIKITIGIEIIDDTHGGSGTVADAISKLQVTTDVHTALKRFEGAGFSQLERTHTNIRNMYGLKVYTFMYESNVLDA